MRCPKCGYISFDSVDECVKCKKSIKSASEILQGSVLNVSAPNFLQFRTSQEDAIEEEPGFGDEISPLDSELAVDENEDFFPEEPGLAEEEEVGEIELSPAGFDEDELEAEVPEVTLDEDEDPEGEIEVDLSQFEEVSDPEASFMKVDEAGEEEDGDVMQISVPEELSDMSDLAPPARKEQVVEVAEEDETMDLDLNLGDDSDDLELDDLNFDLELDDVDTSESAALDPVQETVLSLDDIEFSGDLSADEERGGGDPNSMDSDLDFDLDLGGLSIHKDV